MSTWLAVAPTPETQTWSSSGPARSLLLRQFSALRSALAHYLNWHQWSDVGSESCTCGTGFISVRRHIPMSGHQGVANRIYPHHIHVFKMAHWKQSVKQKVEFCINLKATSDHIPLWVFPFCTSLTTTTQVLHISIFKLFPVSHRLVTHLRWNITLANN